MSYIEQAKSINENLKTAFAELETSAEEENIEKYNDAKKCIIDQMLRFGQVAKFRCRSNTAYDNFAKMCLDDVATIDRVDVVGQDFKALQVVEVE